MREVQGDSKQPKLESPLDVSTHLVSRHMARVPPISSPEYVNGSTLAKEIGGSWH